MMRRVCCVCREGYGMTEGPDGEETHGFCPECFPRMMAGEDYQSIRRSLGQPEENAV